jgi:signal transduction histidine kinase
VTTLNTSLYLLERAPDDRRAEYLSRLKRQVQQLTAFVNAVLDLSRLDVHRNKVPFTAVDFNAVVQQVCDSLASKAELAGLTLICQLEDGLPPVSGDSGQLGQVVTNLVANAINYTPTGQIEVLTGQDGDQGQVYLSVRDTGVGIPADDIPHVFERFYRSNQVSHLPGSGLGLGIVKEIVDLHQGKIEVESESGMGSVFTVWLPVFQESLTV